MYAKVAPRVEIRNKSSNGVLKFTVIIKIATLNMNMIVNGNLKRTNINIYSTLILCSLTLSLRSKATLKKYVNKNTKLNTPSNIVITTQLEVTVVDKRITVLGF